MKQGDLEAIQANESQWQRECFTQVFVKWHDETTFPYTWERVAEALESIDKQELLKEIYEKLSKKIPQG